LRGGVIEVPWLHLLKLPIFYASWLYFPAATFLVWAAATRSLRTRLLAVAALLPITVLAYARFIEPRILLSPEHDIELARCFPEDGALRLALLSDLHIGLFPSAMPISRIARRIAALDVDAALIAGDITYYAPPERYEAIYAPLGRTGAPVYAVLGNHDVGIPGPDVSVPLSAALSRIGVAVFDNRKGALTGRGGVGELVGLSDTWQKRQDFSLLEAASPQPRIVLAHNPATVFDMPEGSHADLIVAGHTHGGQIRIPGFTCRFVGEACWVTLYGYTNAYRTPVFVTSGTGMVGLPMRFLTAPRIDVLNIRYRACEAR
jgi:predicted MPP superfamily phosphohydrolase